MEAQLKQQSFTDYDFMNAVDGNELIPTEHLYTLFKDNDFNYRKGVIGCALSHMTLWKQLVRDSDCELYVIIEDDAEFVDGFEVKLNKAIRLFASEPRAELCFISGFSMKTPCSSMNDMQLIKKKNDTVDGLGGYIVKKSGAARFMQYYAAHSVKRAIDASIVDNFKEHLYELNQYLIKTPFFGPDTDIQQSYDCISFSCCDNANRACEL